MRTLKSWQHHVGRALGELALLGVFGLALLGGVGWVYGSLSAAWRADATAGMVSGIAFAALMIGGLLVLMIHGRRGVRRCIREAQQTRDVLRRAREGAQVRGALEIVTRHEGGHLTQHPAPPE